MPSAALAGVFVAQVTALGSDMVGNVFCIVPDAPEWGKFRAPALQFAEDKASRRRFANESDITWRCRSYGFEEGVIIRSTAGRMIMAPALVATHGEIDELLEKTKRAVDRTARDLGLL
ncbi:putative aminotransferase [Serratia rubidaea]|nr:putative aminotransferase [Serratia rubidaea]